jgi:DNA primase
MSPQTISDKVVNEVAGKHKPEERIVSSDKWENIRSIPVTEFISLFIKLRETGSGAVGLCPFHDDKHSSFGVNESGNYWHCFAGCGGGSVIDFWMKYRGYDFKTAVSDLDNILGGSNERENLHNPGSGKIFEALKEQSLSLGSERENTIYPNRKERKDSGK